ncbi:chemotaxis protein CheV [Pseudohongiella sp.]|uniref:Chemotaxis protein CheW n=1 Tax=marine sediment metagenome TaxID=412755 RepID=A0A0F9Z385_9ZZZZ|nr:chemotaxis protein CheV [Pseudohongiella sp.]HDZ09158.1 chemotaxis protein CheV [Pseudohongiella sp.]HEA63506.1 chemotaxis protein CheV [Pseudohongiella sp.]
MAGVLDSVNQRTQLVGQNRLELLMFRLNGNQMYGINVFKVKEVLPCPPLSVLPHSSRVVRGVAYIRGRTITVLDLSIAMGSRALQDDGKGFIIIAEYNNSVQGFLVSGVDRIVNLNWETIHSPPKGSGRSHYLTAVTEVDNKLVEILDVERILAEVAPAPRILSEALVSKTVRTETINTVLIVDDSSVARTQIKRCCEAIGLNTVVLNDGKQAFLHLQAMAEAGENPADKYVLVISDIEMPEMDGYTLTASIKNDPRLNSLHVMLHTSLSGVFNQSMVEKVGADDFLAKFHPDELAQRVLKQLERRQTPA